MGDFLIYQIIRIYEIHLLNYQKRTAMPNNQKNTKKNGVFKLKTHIRDETH